ncbi:MULTISPECIES: response regulator [Clostridium]|uniref:response regulator n=1 Tax=Clostridium TaxID=1485 RepID=UPI00069D0D33|nr:MULTISPECIES: response regulator [Clostridium]KOF58012.1 transcriptional regulator [Clostridium sp. DMHC 10]MCD2348667.1 response regulator [Clostridium guangxiense]
MRFFIADDDEAICTMLTEIIEDYDLGSIVGTSDNGSNIDKTLLTLKNIDILIIDLLMPICDGIETIRSLGSNLDTKIIMLSQVEDKDIIAEAYSLGVEYYITKPINRLEVIKIIEKVTENIKLQKSIYDIKKTLNILDYDKKTSSENDNMDKKTILTSGKFLLSELGIIGENGSSDLLSMLNYIYNCENAEGSKDEFPALKDIFTNVAIKKLDKNASSSDITKEVKASEQRVRRAISQCLTHLASLGLMDYSNEKFEEYSSSFFDFAEIRKKMLELENNTKSSESKVRINMKKFVKVLYMEAKKKL